MHLAKMKAKLVKQANLEPLGFIFSYLGLHFNYLGFNAST